jgi:diacylglycerol O-acyltransferase / trehalose O-mycolyltransferase
MWRGRGPLVASQSLTGWKLPTVCTIVMLASVAGCTSSPPLSASTPNVTATGSLSSSPARLVQAQQVSDRSWDLTVESPAVGTAVKVRLLVPASFDTSSTTRWPALYLLHGCCDDYQSWTRSTDIERRTRDLDLLVIMPDGGRAGFYSNWQTGPGWEAFHVTELPQLLSENYRASELRVIAGVSMGGLGALGYAARHPGMFRAVASFSGIVHTRQSQETSRAYLRLIASQGEEPLHLWGDPQADAAVWAQHNPFDLADRLRGVRIYLSSGNGQPGPLDPAGTTPDPIETALGQENQRFAERLQSLGIAARLSLYGPGTHNWVYWQRELDDAWPMITEELDLA